MDHVLTKLIRLVNVIRNQSKQVIVGAAVVTAMVIALAVFLTAGPSANNATAGPKTIASSANRESTVGTPENTESTVTTSGETKTNGEVKSANTTTTTGTGTNNKQASTANKSTTTPTKSGATPATTPGPTPTTPGSTPTPNPTPVPTPPNPNASFSISELASNLPKDKTTNTLFWKFAIVHEPGHTANVTTSVAGYGMGITCAINAGNVIAMTMPAELPADFYGCNLVANDGKTSKNQYFTIHHSGGPTNL